MTAIQLYEKQYRDLGFERLGLFKVIKERFNPQTVLYMGSSIHITPSLAFQNVTYLDNSSLSADFFKEKESLIDFIGREKQYKQNPWLQFIEGDYTSSSFRTERKFDLVISLFSPGSLLPSIDALGPEGILLFLPLPSDPIRDCDYDRLNCLGYIQYKKKKYQFYPDVKKVTNRNINTGRYIKGDLFRENNSYEIYRLSDGINWIL